MRCALLPLLKNLPSDFSKVRILADGGTHFIGSLGNGFIDAR